MDVGNEAESGRTPGVHGRRGSEQTNKKGETPQARMEMLMGEGQGEERDRRRRRKMQRKRNKR
jgi:hypothetical protein